MEGRRKEMRKLTKSLLVKLLLAVALVFSASKKGTIATEFFLTQHRELKNGQF